MKCPFCDSQELIKLDPNIFKTNDTPTDYFYDSFKIVATNSQNNDSSSNNYLSVEAFECKSCQFLAFKRIN